MTDNTFFHNETELFDVGFVLAKLVLDFQFRFQVQSKLLGSSLLLPCILLVIWFKRQYNCKLSNHDVDVEILGQSQWS